MHFTVKHSTVQLKKSENPEVHPMLGEVSCATVSPHFTYVIHTYEGSVIRHSVSCNPISRTWMLKFPKPEEDTGEQ